MIGKDMTDFRFSSESAGFRDGPSAGGLMTAGFIASMLGAKIDPAATMTGTVNPDGTIGPVGGIPQKFAAGAAAGKKRLGYPVGQRFDTDMNTKEKVDLKEVARANGADATEISDVYQAYEFLTGTPLPHPEAIDEKEMQIGDAVEKKIADKYAGWAELYARHADEIVALYKAGNLPKGLFDLAKIAQTESQEAAKLVQQGLPATAYLRIVRATVYAAAATSVAAILDDVQKNDVKGAFALLDKEVAVQDRTTTAIDSIAKTIPATIGDHLLQISAYASAVKGWGAEKWGIDRLTREIDDLHSMDKMSAERLASNEVRDALVDAIASPILMLTSGEAQARVAEESLEIEAVESLAYKCSVPNAEALATSFASAAAANTAYFESLFVKDFSEEKNIAEKTVIDLIMAAEPRYLVAKFAFQIGLFAAGQGEFHWKKDDLPMVLLTLSASIMSYLESSSVIADWYSLDVQREGGVIHGGEVKGIGQEKAFINMLTQAEEKAREHANEAKIAIGQVPIQARIHYQNAKVLRDGSDKDKLDALEEFWWASAYSQIAVMLARN
jgi:hypothetical protein